jgi:hypothetical protein
MMGPIPAPSRTVTNGVMGPQTMAIAVPLRQLFVTMDEPGGINYIISYDIQHGTLKPSTWYYQNPNAFGLAFSTNPNSKW